MSFAMSISNLLAVVTEFCHVDLIPLLFGLLLLSESVGGLAGTSLYSKYSQLGVMFSYVYSLVNKWPTTQAATQVFQIKIFEVGFQLSEVIL